MRYLTESLVALAILACLTACRHPVDYIDPATNESLVSVNEINVQDWADAGRKLVDSLLANGALQRQDARPSIIMVSRIENKTRQHVDTALLTKKIRVAVLNSGQAITTTAVGVDGPEEEASMGVRNTRKSDEFDQSTVPGKGQLQAPDYALGGQIIELDAKVGRKTQTTFAFQMSLTDVRTGLAVWEDEVTIIKQGTRPGVGW